jgi:hypothetical protein
MAGATTDEGVRDMKFSYTAVWEDAVGLARAHGSLVVALAGVFLFLPALMVGHFLPRPEPTEAGQLIPLMVEYGRANWHWIVLESLLNMAGTLAIMFLVFGRAGISVGGAIAAAFALLPGYFVAAVLGNIAIGAGLALFVLPGIYLMGRLAPLAAVVVAEGVRNPFAALRRTFAVTRGNGWAIAGLIVVVAVAGSILLLVLASLAGILFAILLPQDTARFVMLVLTTAAGAALTALLVLLYAAVYRRLAAREPDAAVFR